MAQRLVTHTVGRVKPGLGLPLRGAAMVINKRSISAARAMAAAAVAFWSLLSLVFVLGILSMSLAHATSPAWQAVGVAVMTVMGLLIVSSGVVAVAFLLRLPAAAQR